MPNPFLYIQTNLFQAIQFSINKQFQGQKTVPFKINKYRVNTQFSSIWLIHRTLCVATAPGHREPWGEDSEGVLRIPQSSSATGTSPYYYQIRTLIGAVFPLFRDAAIDFYRPSRLGKTYNREQLTSKRRNPKYTYIYIYIERERERERQTDRQKGRQTEHIYIYIYI